jgi:hypothetical protein
MSYQGIGQQAQPAAPVTMQQLDGKLTHLLALCWTIGAMVLVTLIVVLWWSYKVLKLAAEIHDALTGSGLGN